MPFEMFLDLTPREFFEALWEKEEHEKNIVTAQVRVVCEAIRLQTAHLLNVQLKKKITDLKKIMHFQWEAEETKTPQTMEEMKLSMKAIARFYARKKKKLKDGKGKKR